MPEKRLKKLGKVIGCFAAATLFLLLCGWFLYRVPLWKIYLPSSNWSDEVLYSKQLSAVQKYGGPLGYFGYNESHADIGTFASWGPLGTYLYAIPGLLFHGQNAALYCNVFFMAVAWCFFAISAKLPWQRQALFALAVAALAAPVRYTFSAMQEPMNYALCFAIFGAGILVQRKKTCAAWIALLVLCALATITRAYNIALFLYPLLLAWPNRKNVAIVTVSGAASLGATLLQMDKFSAAYFTENVDFQPIKWLLRLDFISLFQRLRSVMQYIAEQMRQGVQSRTGGHCLVLLLLTVFVLVCTIWDGVHKRPILWRAATLVIVAVIFGALVLMYLPSELNRHTLPLDLLLLTALIVEQPAISAAAVSVSLAVLSLLSVFNLADRQNGYGLPTYSEQTAQEIAELSAVLTKNQSTLSINDRWDRTCAFAMNGDVPISMLYALPDGMGIQIDEGTYLLDPEKVIYSRYVMAMPGSEAGQYLTAQGWKLLYAGEQAAVFERA